MIAKYSYGIILIFDNKVLLVQRRFTYAFMDFIMGKYSNLDSVKKLLNEMTLVELSDIYSLDFNKLWDKLWLPYQTLQKPNAFLYEKVFNKFKTFFLFDGGDRLRSFIDQSVPTGALIWNIPRGRKNTSKETDIYCAMRELDEETGYKKVDYTILPNYNKEVSYIHGDTKYICKYFIASLNIHPSDKHFDSKNMREVADNKWVSMAEIPYINPKPYLITIVRNAVKLVKKYKKGKYAVDYPIVTNI